MNQPQQTDVTRGAAEEASGARLTETEAATSQRPASQPPSGAAGDSADDGEHGTPDPRIAEAAESLGAGSASDDAGVGPLEERPDVAAAIQDDTTAPGLGDAR